MSTAVELSPSERAAETAARIRAHLESGGVVQATGYGRSTVYEGPKWATCFRANGAHVEVRRGRSWDSLLVYYPGGTFSGLAVRLGRFGHAR